MVSASVTLSARPHTGGIEMCSERERERDVSESHPASMDDSRESLPESFLSPSLLNSLRSWGKEDGSPQEMFLSV